MDGNNKDHKTNRSRRTDTKTPDRPILMLLQWKHQVTDRAKLEQEQLRYSIINIRINRSYILNRNNKFVLDIK